MSGGAATWLAIALAALVLLAATTALPAARPAALWHVVGWFLRCWGGRLVLLALWAEAGFHLLCQRP